MEVNQNVLECLKGLGEFYYCPNGGNLGDQVINYATREFFHRHRLSWLPWPPSEGDCPVTLVYGGGGSFVPYYGMVPGLLKLFRLPRLRRVVILPSSFYQCDELADCFDERFTVFCREAQSLRYMEGRNRKTCFLLADDMALTLDAREVLDRMPEETFRDPYFREKAEELEQYMHTAGDGRRVLLLLRRDAESRLEKPLPQYWAYDLSGLVNGATGDDVLNPFLTCLFLHGLDQADVILTDRLHGALCGLMLGKEVYLLDNCYGKLRAVYEHSLKSRHSRGRFLESSAEFPWKELGLEMPSALRKQPRGREKKSISILVGICSAQLCGARRQGGAGDVAASPARGGRVPVFSGRGSSAGGRRRYGGTGRA